MTPPLSPTQETVLHALKACVAREGGAVTAREVIDHCSGWWPQASVYSALSRLERRGLVRRVGWGGTARTWEPTDRA